MVNVSNEYRYILEKGSKKHHCPECNKKTFVCYLDNETSNYLPEIYGRCDRESKCSYHHSPYKDGYSKMIWIQEQGQDISDWKPQRIAHKSLPPVKTTFIPVEVLKQTLKNYEQNNFIQNLLQSVSFPFMVTDIEKVISLYRLGTISKGYRAGAITFPFIDINGNVRAIQVKQFDKTNHTTGTDFIHSIIEKHHAKNSKSLPVWLEAYKMNETKVSCLFGEHLLGKYPDRPVALVEAPKTAVYSTLYFGTPEQSNSLIWLAVFNLSSLNLNKCKSLKGRNVYLFPDLSKDGKAFDLWSEKAKIIENQLEGSKFIVSDLLEKLAPEKDRERGSDLADYLIEQDWRKFRKEPIQIEESISEKELLPKVEIEVQSENLTRPDVGRSVDEFELYFKSITLPATVKLNQSSTITDIPLFIESHLSIIKANSEKPKYLPYLNRLNELKQVLAVDDIGSLH